MLPDLSALSVPTGMDGGSPPPARRLHDDEDKENMPHANAGHVVVDDDNDDDDDDEPLSMAHPHQWALTAQGQATMAEFNAAADANVGLLLAERIDLSFASNGGRLLGVVDAPWGIINDSPGAPNAQTLEFLNTMVVGCFVAYLNRGARFAASEDGTIGIALPAAEWGLGDATAMLHAHKSGENEQWFKVLINWGDSWSVQE